MTVLRKILLTYFHSLSYNGLCPASAVVHADITFPCTFTSIISINQKGRYFKRTKVTVLIFHVSGRDEVIFEDER